MCLAETQQRENLVNKINDLAEIEKSNDEVQTAVRTWFEAYDDGDMSRIASTGLLEVLKSQELTGASKELYEIIKSDTQRHSFTAPALSPAMAPETAFGPVLILHAAELFSIVPVAQRDRKSVV